MPSSELTPEVLAQQFETAIIAAERLRQQPIAEVLARLDHVIVDWLRPASPWMALATDRLPAATGFSVAMIRHALPMMLAPLRADSIAQTLEAELGSTDRLPATRLPRALVQILAGNIPAVGIPNTCLALALGIPIIVKPASGDPLFPELFAQSLRHFDAGLADAQQVAHWRGGDSIFETTAFGLADVVTAFGSDGALAAIASRVRGRFIGHGHKTSFALIGREVLGDAAGRAKAADDLAYDMSLWDQFGCLSPQLCYVEQTDNAILEQFLGCLMSALDRWATRLPPGSRSFEGHAAIQRFRQDAEWNDSRSGLPQVLASAGSTEWSVAVETDPTFVPTCLHRTLRLKIVPDIEVLRDVLAPVRHMLEAAGLSITPERIGRMTSILQVAGVHRICPLGTMQQPDLGWRQGGLPRIANWLSDPHES